MKIIAKDNFARENRSEYLVAEGIKSTQFAKVMCDALQTKFGGETSQDYFKVVDDDHKLYVFDPV